MNITNEKHNSEYFRFSATNEEGVEMGRVFLFVIKNNLREEPYALIEDLFVEEEYRSKGIATNLMNQLFEKAKELGCSKIIGQSRYGKEDIHAWYERMGLKDHGKNFRMNLM